MYKEITRDSSNNTIELIVCVYVSVGVCKSNLWVGLLNAARGYYVHDPFIFFLYFEMLFCIHLTWRAKYKRHSSKQKLSSLSCVDEDDDDILFVFID